MITLSLSLTSGLLGGGDALASESSTDSGNSVIAGRVTTLDLGEENVARVEVISKPDYGNLTVNPDNTLALVLTGTTQTDKLNFDIRVTYDDGSTADHTVTLDVTEGLHDDGWGAGDFYMLETVADGSVVVETGEQHRKVYVSGSPSAWGVAEIEAAEGVTLGSQAEQIAFLKDHPEYGSAERPLDEDLGNKLWNSISHQSAGPQSNWLLLERGYTYDTIHIWPDKATGESALHPMYIGAFGEGDRPEITEGIRVTGASHNVIIDGLNFTGGLGYVASDGGSNILLTDVEADKDIGFQSGIDGLTIRNSFFHDAYHDDPVGGTWEPNINRVSALYIDQADGVLLENNFVDHAGWGEGYDSDSDPDPNLPQPPSKFSHDLYIQSTTYDVTLRDNIIMRGAGSGVQFRSGGFAEDNLFLDSNGAIMFSGGGSSDVANYTLFLGNVITSGGHRLTEVQAGTGEVTAGVNDQAYLSALVDNIVAHAADPNNPAEILEKVFLNYALNFANGDDAAFYNDTVVYNWGERPGDQNVSGLDSAQMDATTIQLFTDALRDTSGSSIDDFSNYFRALLAQKYDVNASVQDVLDFFRAGFGIDTSERESPAILRFVPDERGDGVRWDNRLNWDSGDLPGTRDGDSVDLAGNWVNYDGTTRIAELNFGDGGRLTVNHGLLEIDGKIWIGGARADLKIDNAGQVWIDGYTGRDLLGIEANGGRFANTGSFDGKAQLNASDDAQILLATDGAEYLMSAGSRLTVVGDRTRVGFDGDEGDTAVLLMSDRSTLRFIAEDGGIGKISEFTSGHFDAAGSGVRSGVNLGDATLKVDVSDIAASGFARYELISVNELIGAFGDIEITGLAADQDARITVDYDKDKVFLIIGDIGRGTGSVSVSLVGSEASAQKDAGLYDALTEWYGAAPVGRPGSIDRVKFTGPNVVETLDFDDAGIVVAVKGALKVTDQMLVGSDGGVLRVRNDGQVWVDGYSDSDRLKITVKDGLFANTGVFDGLTRLVAKDTGQALLATDGGEYDMGAGGRLVIRGGDTRVGFDGEDGGTAVLHMAKRATLKFVAQDGQIGSISEFDSGQFSASGDGVRSGVDLDNAKLVIKLPTFSWLSAGSYDLIDVDELVGQFGKIKIKGLADDQDALVRINYNTDKVVLVLGEVGAGSGDISTVTQGDADSAMADSGLYDVLSAEHLAFADTPYL